MNISICIPTFNRPESLDRVLQHLSSFQSLPYEIIIGDNSGTGSASPIAEKYKATFPSLIYLNRPINIGFTRNQDSIARIGTAPYIYILSDDDFVYESALTTMTNILDSNPDVIAINGGYEGTRHGVIGLDKDISNGVVSRVQKGNYEQLWNNFGITDNHPLIRRVDFILHARYREISCAVAPVIFDLLKYGDFIHIHAPVLQHEQRSDSISARIASHEVTDLVNGDLEIISCKANLLDYDGSTVRGSTVRNVYFQGARALFSKGEYLAGWHSIMRCNAYQGLQEKTKIWIEKNILSKVISEKICQIAADTGCASICSNSSNINHTWVNSLNTELAGLPNTVPSDNDNTRKLILTTSYNVQTNSLFEVFISITSLTTQFSLSGYDIEIDASHDSPLIVSTNQIWNEIDISDEIQIEALLTPYA